MDAASIVLLAGIVLAGIGAILTAAGNESGI